MWYFGIKSGLGDKDLWNKEIDLQGADFGNGGGDY